MDDLRVTDDITIPAAELGERFSTSGGPGGQHANRAATRATVSFDVASSTAFDDTQRRRLLERLGSRLSGGVLLISVDESRSQWRNRQLARQRLAETLRVALRTERRRVPTRPTRASQRRRLDEKKTRGRLKRLRRKPDLD